MYSVYKESQKKKFSYLFFTSKNKLKERKTLHGTSLSNDRKKMLVSKYDEETNAPQGKQRIQRLVFPTSTR